VLALLGVVLEVVVADDPEAAVVAVEAGEDEPHAATKAAPVSTTKPTTVVRPKDVKDMVSPGWVTARGEVASDVSPRAERSDGRSAISAWSR
jgi:hypothetical protein